MSASGNIPKVSYPAASNKIQTQTIRVLLTTDDYEIDGLMHIRPGSYQSRVSDILNVKEMHFVPLTHVTYRSLRNPGEPARTAETMILRLDTIKMAVPLEHEEKAPAGPVAPGGMTSRN
ncbi:MAG: hypothetical protein M1455_11755 [Actinobacteria bacterium]|nr:hypothetical protein [Actinomycetota bacterium]